jgi:type IV pilus assembly protein PilZ
VELRRFNRAPLQQPCRFAVKAATETTEGLARDISLGGMFVETPTPAQFGAEVVIHITLPAGKPNQTIDCKLPGIVRWNRDGGMGVQFGNLGARETFAITEIVKRHETT